MKDIKLVIFDLDGTLIDAYRAIINSVNYTLRTLGYPKEDDADIRRAVGWGDENLLGAFLKKDDIPRALVIYRRYHAKALLSGSRIFPGVKVLLSGLKKKGYKLAVASNRPTRFSLILIRHLQLSRYFDYVLCADKLRHGKPYPDIINRIRGKFSLKREKTVYVGDMAIDVQAGRAAGVKTMAVTTGSSTARELKREKPYKILRNIKDLSLFLLPLRKKRLTRR